MPELRGFYRRDKYVVRLANLILRAASPKYRAFLTQFYRRGIEHYYGEARQTIKEEAA